MKKTREKEQKESYVPSEGGSGSKIFKTSKSKFIYYALVILVVAVAVIVIAS